MFRIRRASAVALVFLSLTASGCLFFPGREAKVGAAENEKVETTMGFLKDEALVAYVESVGEQVLAVSSRAGSEFHFQIVDMPEPNAFALPGGYVYVSRGLLALVNSEDELAGVIGHEIGHVTARHAASRVSLAAPFAIATGLTGFAVGIVSPTLGNAVAGTTGALASGLVISPFSREQENHADDIGLELAAKAGYDPAGLGHFLHTLDRESTLEAGEQREFHILDTHPLTPARVERTAKRAKDLERATPAPIAKTQSEFFSKIEGIVVGHDPYQGVFTEELFSQPHLRFKVEFPTGWETRDTPSAVGAISPSQDAMLAGRFSAMESTLDDVVEKVREEEPDLEIDSLEIHGLPAARAGFSHRGQSFHVIWIGHGGDVYQFVGVSEDQTATRYAKIFDKSVGTFQPMTAPERKAIRESRLRIRSAKSGETPTEISKRFDSSWDGPRIAAANALDDDAALEAGHTVKVAIPQSYTDSPR